MKKIIAFTLSAIVLLCCLAGCGAKRDPKYYGKWETSKEYLSGRERDKTDMTYNCYDLAADGSGVWWNADGNKQQVSWEVTSDGGVRILYEEMGEFTEYYDFMGCDLVTKKQTDEGTLDIYLAKVNKFSGKGAET